MKKFVAIFFFFILFVQAIPVQQFFGAETPVYVLIDEDKHEDTKTKKAKDGKELTDCSSFVLAAPEASIVYGRSKKEGLAQPYLDSFSPPPDGLISASAVVSPA